MYEHFSHLVRESINITSYPQRHTHEMQTPVIKGSLNLVLVLHKCLNTLSNESKRQGLIN